MSDPLPKLRLVSRAETAVNCRDLISIARPPRVCPKLPGHRDETRWAFDHHGSQKRDRDEPHLDNPISLHFTGRMPQISNRQFSWAHA